MNEVGFQRAMRVVMAKSEQARRRLREMQMAAEKTGLRKLSSELHEVIMLLE